jgi:hypothetical protein
MPGRLVEKRLAQEALVWKAPVECTLSDSRCPGYLFHVDARDTALLEERPRRTQDHPPVARRIAALSLAARRAPQVIQAPPYTLYPSMLHDYHSPLRP